ncbi:MAG: hypothetical protein P4M15_07410 [Alphaproteobacteria bacterium]|nr:hypothetical protein [Alphaproteobacteria bacterium]
MQPVSRNLMIFVAVVIVAFLAYGVLTMKDNRTLPDRVGDAVHALPNLDKASEKLEDQTPGQKLGDAIKDTGEDIKKNTAPQ